MRSRSGPDGNLWFTEWRVEQIGEINPTTHAITEFSINSGANGPSDITTGPDGNLWFTTARRHDQPDEPRHYHLVRRWHIRGDRVGPRRQPLVYRGRSRATSVRSTRRPMPSASSPVPGEACLAESRRAPTATSGSRRACAGRSRTFNPTTDAATEYPIPYAGTVAKRDHGGPRWQRLVHRQRDRRDRRRHPGHIATGGDHAAASQRHCRQRLRPDGRGREQLGEPHHLVQRHGHRGAGEQPRRRHPRRYAVADRASGGVATFSGLTLTTAASGYTLDVSAQRPRRGRHQRHHRDARGGHAAW